MSEETLLKELACPKGGNLRAIKAVIRKEKLSFMERTASEALEKEHRKHAETDPDEFQREIHRQLAEAQAKMRKEGTVELQLQCPDHPGKGEYSFFFENLPQYAPVIKANLLRCLKCGAPVTLEDTKISGGFKLLTIQCPQHGSGQRKISSSIHDTIMEAAQPSLTPPPIETDVQTLQIEPTLPKESGTTISFCWNCGAKAIDATSEYCYKCGVSLRPP
ncbi:MAG: hypothetical protein ACFFDU_04380 [Candidatus Thorarchaeota archaeon]